jgi:hypothetical protein
VRSSALIFSSLSTHPQIVVFFIQFKTAVRIGLLFLNVLSQCCQFCIQIR